MRRPELPPTQKELAKALGMAQSTVSMALRGHPSITGKTRELVANAAEAMGYQPNPSGTALAHLRQASTVQPVQSSLAWINGWHEPAKLRGFQEFENYWKGASEGAAELGYRLDEFVVGPDFPMARLEQVLRARNVRGILMPPGPMPDGWRQFAWSNFAVVRLCHFADGENLPACSVTGDQVNNAHLAFQQIRRKGYRRIGFVGNEGPERSFTAGFLWAQQDLPEGLRLPSLVMTNENQSAWEQRFREWFVRNRPDAILTDVPQVPAELARMGVSVPADVGLAALGILDCPISAGIDQNSREIGGSGVRMLHSLVKENAYGVPAIHRELLIKGTWVNGDSLPDRLTEKRRQPARLPQWAGAGDDCRAAC